MVARFLLLAFVGLLGSTWADEAIPEGLPEGTKLIADGIGFPEGPMIARDGTLYFSGVNENKIYKYVNGKPEVFYGDNEDGANGLALHRDGTIYAAAGRAKAILKLAPDGKATKWITEVNGEPLNAPNDLVFDAQGNLFFTNPAGFQSGGDPSKPSVIRVTPDGKAMIIDADVQYPNGIGISPDGKYLYVNELMRGSLVYRYELKNGEIGKKDELIKFGGGMPDGMAIAASGNLYVALNLHAKVVVVSPEGKILKEVQFPKGSGVTNACFGGPDMKTLFVTLGNAKKVYAIPVDEPGAKLFGNL